MRAVSIIIVNFNSGNLLNACVTSILRYVKVDFEVIVVDNASSDGSENSVFYDGCRLKLVRSTTNGGFAKGSNLGAQNASGKILHFLNPDAEVGPDINEAYQTALSNPDRIYATHITDTYRNLESRGHAFPTLQNVFNLAFRRDQIQKWYIGASVILSVSNFRRISGWSEEYFMYVEDMDLFYKAHLAGIHSELLPTRVRHYQGGTTRKVWSEDERFLRVERSALIFAKKFNLGFDYFIFKHLASLKNLFRSPKYVCLDLFAYWKALIETRPQESFCEKSSERMDAI